MSWETIMVKEQIEIRYDSKNKNIIVEVNSKGFQPNYVTLQLDKNETSELISALKEAEGKAFID